MLKSIGFVLLVAALPQGAPVQTAGTAVLSGVVTRVDNDKPVPGALVLLQRVPAQRDVPPPMVRTDEAGAFRFEKLPAGGYMVFVSADRHFPTDATTTRPGGLGKRIDVTEGQQIERYSLSLVPSGAVEGRTLDEFGDPAPGVTMMITQLMQAAGRSRLMPLGTRQTSVTDDRGVFRIAGLAPGDYYLLALSGPFGTGTSAMSMPADTRAGFAPTYFPGTANAADARVVHLPIGREATGLSFGLVASKLYSVSGRITDAAGAAAAGTVMMLQTQGGDVRAIVPANSTAGADGAFVYRNVPQGTYVLQASTQKGFGTAQVIVNDRDIAEIKIPVLPARTARGHVTFEGGNPPQKEVVRIAVAPTDVVSSPIAPIGPVQRSRVNDDGTFELPGILSVGVLTAQAPPNWFLRRVTLAGEDITDKPYDFRTRDVADLEVLLSDRWASVLLTVTDVAGNPAADTTVIVFPQDGAKWTFPSRYVLVSRTNQQGVFKGGALPGGSYLAVAVPPGIASSQDIDPVVLESLRAASTRVTLVEGSETAAPLTLVR